MVDEELVFLALPLAPLAVVPRLAVVREVQLVVVLDEEQLAVVPLRRPLAVAVEELAVAVAVAVASTTPCRTSRSDRDASGPRAQPRS